MSLVPVRAFLSQALWNHHLPHGAQVLRAGSGPQELGILQAQSGDTLLSADVACSGVTQAS